MPAKIVVTSLARHFAPRVGPDRARAAAESFMGALSARIGRPVAWDDRDDAPLLEERLEDGAFPALVFAAVRLDDPPGMAYPSAAAAIEAARLRLRRTRFPHLVRAGTIFLPVGFDRPIEVRRTPLGGDTVLGSGSRLLAEAEQIQDEIGRAAEAARWAPPAALAPLLALAREALRLRLPLLVEERLLPS